MKEVDYSSSLHVTISYHIVLIYIPKVQVKICFFVEFSVIYFSIDFFKIIKSLREQLNRIYVKFINRNPDFLTRGGKVSVISHSLGSVIFHDILTKWNDQLLDEHKQQADINMAAEGRWSWIWGSRRRREASESFDETATQTDEISALQEELRNTKEKVADLEARIFAERNNATQSTASPKKKHDCSLPFKVMLPEMFFHVDIHLLLMLAND